MALGNWLRRLFGSRKPDTMSDVALKTSAQHTANILVRARDSTQIEKVTDVVRQLEQIWPDDKNKQLVSVILMIKESYVHLERMADVEPLSEVWLGEWAEAVRVANDNADELARQQERTSRFLDEWEKRR